MVAPVFTLKDSGPTKTFTFDLLVDYTFHLDNRKLSHFAKTDNEGQETISLQMWLEQYKFFFQLTNDSDWPSSGESCSDKWEDLRTWIKTGGDNDGRFTVTFNREDSKIATPTTYVFEGAVKHLHKKSVGGEHVATIDGDFEFYVHDDPSS
jgi:hypothetical protein